MEKDNGHKIKALFTYDYGKENMDNIRALGYEIIYRSEKDIVYDNSMEEVEVLICYNPFETLDISKMDSLKWIQLSSIGIDQLPGDAVLKNNIMVTNNRGGYSIPMGEWIVLKVLELYKNSRTFYENQINKTWKVDTSVLELYGKTVGFVGTGSIAVEAAKRLQGFGVEILGLNTKGNDVEYFNKCFKSEEIDEMLEKSDVVVLSIPHTKETHHLINEERIKKVKNNALLINISRGSIIEESALIKYLKSGKIKGAALDVFEEEPLEKDSELWNLKNIIVTPHNSWMSEMRNVRRFETIYENMENYVEGSKLKNLVNVEKGY